VSAIHQRYVVLPFRQKVDALVRFLALNDSRSEDADSADAAVVFVRTRSACEEVGAQLAERGVSVAVISGDVSQRERERTIARLRGRQVDVLVATDVAARGLDIERIGLVVNFDAPTDPETYVHRVGRTGRAGRAGQALLFVTPRETGRVRSIERATGQRLEETAVPTAAQVTAHRATAGLAAAVQRHGAGRLDACRSAIEAAAAASGLSVPELAAALLAVTVGDDGTPPEPVTPVAERRPGRDRSERTDRGQRRDRDERDRPARHDSREHAESSLRTAAGRRAERTRRADAEIVRYVVQVGRRHGVRPAGIVGAITGEGGLSGSDLGRIDIFDEHSVVEISRPVGAAALARIRRATVSGQQLRIRPDRPASRGDAPARSERPAKRPAAQNRAGWASGGAGRSRGGRLPAGKRDSALPGTPRSS
jgi:ATP-dependent RNA helicase DeaD